MKFRATLPDRKHYVALSGDRTRWIFQDAATDSIEIFSPIPYPFDREWGILISLKWGKSDRSKYLTKVQFKLYEPNDSFPYAYMIRERYKAKLSAIDTTHTLQVIEAPGGGLTRVLYRFEAV